jgi:hypothetical protein
MFSCLPSLIEVSRAAWCGVPLEMKEITIPIWGTKGLSTRPRCIILITHSFLLTYSLTPWNRVFLEKLTGFAASQKFPRIYGTRMFIPVLTSARHLSLTWARSIQFPQPPPTSWRSLLILSSHLRLGLPNGLFPFFWGLLLHLFSYHRPILVARYGD